MTFIVVPFPSDVPPQETEYHCHEAPVPNVPPLNVKAEVEPGQISDGSADAEPAAPDIVLSVTVV